MKHLINKSMVQGGGKKKPKSEPPILKPPKLGAYQILNSYSVAEIIDLISDGPIEGLVNQNGQRLKGEKILEGIYLDNTPIKQTSQDELIISSKDKIAELSIKDRLNSIGSIYFDFNKNQYYSHTHLGTNNITLNQQITSFPIVSRGDDPLPLLTLYDGINTKINNTTNYSSMFTYYSPVVGNFYSPNLNNPPWSYIGNSAKLGQVFTSNYFFRNTISKIEIHYKKPSNTLLGSDSLFNTFDKYVNAVNSTSPEQTSIISNIRDKITKFKQQINDSEQAAYILIPIGDWSNTNAIKKEQLTTSQNPRNFYDEKGVKKEVSFYLQEFSDGSRDITSNYFLIPEVVNSEYTGQIFGCIVFELILNIRNIDGWKESAYHTIERVTASFKDLSMFLKDNTTLVFKYGGEVETVKQDSKYNFSNISCEFKSGEEYQERLNNFNYINVDYDYNSQLLGPFSKSGNVKRITSDFNTKGPSNPTLSSSAKQDGSNDPRVVGNQNTDYSNWNNNNEFDESASSITHTVENPNVSSLFFTITVSSLSDTAHTDLTGEDRKAGDKLPSIVEIEVEHGKINTEGQKINVDRKSYAIIGLIEGQMMIDFGSRDLDSLNPMLSSIKDISDGSFKDSKINEPIILQPILANEDPTLVKRYVKITKLSSETNSVLIKKDISLFKVTEIIEQNLSYPFSCINGIKIDARTFPSAPERTYDCRLKKIKIPSNYKPLDDKGLDKRYIKSASSYSQDNLVYDGDWDGSFIEGWTDNPAWIIYDLLTSKRYGLGSYIEEEQINKWQLYKIGRFCDDVDEDGFFKGVPDGVGGLEPRYSCNIVFREQTKLFDAINIVAGLFRGSVYFSNSEINFLDDRPREIISIFTNSNVKDGVFNYINNRRDQQFNTVEVAYLDRFDNYQTKIEYVQNEADIRKRGIFKTDINTLGVTSRAMARRIGQHLIYQTTKENQSVEFSAGLEALLCKPGDLIVVEDEMKTRLNNYGKVLEVNTLNKTLRIDNYYVDSVVSSNGKVTVYTPTGFVTSDEVQGLATIDRSRIPYFDVTGNLINGDDSILTGRYYFSEYVSGYPSGSLNPNQFPLYTGLNGSSTKTFCYFNTGATGFVFSTGLPYQNNNTYDKVICSNNFFDIVSIRNPNQIASISGYRYNSSITDKRSSPSGLISGKLDVLFDKNYRGVLEEEISVVNHPQITTFNITGASSLDYGSLLFVDQNDTNINMLSKVPQGSVYRIQKPNPNDQVYKVISIREDNQNEYTLYCSKFNSGKFEEIEKNISKDYIEPAKQIDKSTYIGYYELDIPKIVEFKTGLFGGNLLFTGSWSGVENASSYDVYLTNLVYPQYAQTLNVSTTGFSNPMLNPKDGPVNLRVVARNDSAGYILNSEESISGIFVRPTGNASAGSI